jgi:outer membrane protein assembly factor BamE (lipoprotein component of BamABCDE complex)
MRFAGYHLGYSFFMYRKLHFGLVALLASFLTACSTVESRIKSNPQVYASLSPADQAWVRQGQIREGMSKAAVFLAWGNPDRIRTGVRLGYPFEAWVYTFERSAVLPDYYYYPGL